MLQDLSEYFVIGSGEVVLHPEVINLADLVREICGDFQGMETAHKLVVQLPAAPVHLRADHEKVRRILENLLTNAFKYSPEGSTVMTRVRLAGEEDHDGIQAIIEVEDEGMGIPEEMRERIFEPFVRLSDRQKSGQGLGLHIVSVLAQAHGGRAWVETGCGGGSLFCVALPLINRA
jgi:signal transduction histidine kinase